MYRVVPCTSRLKLNVDWFAYTQNKETSLANDQLDAQIFNTFCTCTYFEQYLAHPQEVKLY